jgi:hypothetical protein
LSDASLLGEGATGCTTAAAGRNTSITPVGAAILCSGGGSGTGGGSRFWMFHHPWHFGPSPAPPRVHFVYPNGKPILKAK